jgi:hypothetical protein
MPPDLFPEPISFKQIAFTIVTIGFLVVAIPAAIRYAWVERVCIAGIMFMAINPVDVTFFSYTEYRGDIRGIEFGVPDWFTITLAVTMLVAPRWKKRRLYYRSPNDVLMWLYFALCAASILTAIIPQFAFFGVTRMVRAYLLFWIAYNYVRSEEDLRFIIWTVVGLTFYSFWQVFLDKYVRGVFPPRGSFPHQNSLVTFQNIMNFIIFAMLLGDTNKVFDKRTMIYWAALGAGSLTSVATLSRGGMATMVMGYMLLVPLLIFLKQSSKRLVKKLSALGVMFVAALPALVAVLPQIIRRFQTAPPESAEARHLFNDLATEMGSSSFFGIGLNNYSYAGGWGEYKQFLPPIDQGGLAHNIYYISYAELGPLGPVLWTLMMLGFIFVMLRFILKRRDGIERIFTIGVMAGFVIAMLIGKLEWNFRQTQLMFTYMMFAGLAMSMPRVEKERRALEGRKRKMQLWLIAQHARQVAGRRHRRQGGVKTPGRRVARHAHAQPARRDLIPGS